MLNEALLLKVFLPCTVWLREQHGGKIFRLVWWKSLMVVFVLHKRIRLKTSRLSYGFAFGDFFDDSDACCSLSPSSACECTRSSFSVFLPPSKTTSAALVSRSWRC